MSSTPSPVDSVTTSVTPKRSGVILTTLILVALIANLNLAVTFVALPEIGLSFSASQTELNLMSVAYSLGLAATVLYFGAIGDRYGRKSMLVIGTILSIPACLLAAWAPSMEVLIFARLFGGLAAGMAYPTTLALITALWAGPARTKTIALWSAIGGAGSALGPLSAGALLQHYWWGSIFLITIPLALVAIPLTIKSVPNHVNESTKKVDNIGGIFSLVFIGSLVIAISFAAEPDKGMFALEMGIIAVGAGGAFILRQKRAANPLFPLNIAGRRIFWVAAAAGIIVFGSLMAAMFIGQQFLQNVLGYDPIESGAAILPAAVLMVLVAPRSAKIVDAYGARFTLLLGYVFCFLAFVVMILFWKEGIDYWVVGIAYAFIGVGIGLAGTPASHSLTGSVPPAQAGMASGTADLQRDLGGAIMQSITGAFLTAGYAAAFAAAIAASAASGQISTETQSQLTKSFSSAAITAEQYPQYAPQIISAAKTSFIQGADWAYSAGMVAIVLGFGLVFFFFPKVSKENALLQEYHDQDGTNLEPETVV